MSGIFRDVELINEEKNAILDVQVDGTLDDSYQTGLFTARITGKQPLKQAAWKLSYRGEMVASGEASPRSAGSVLNAELRDVHPWTAETPGIYEFYPSVPGLRK